MMEAALTPPQRGLCVLAGSFLETVAPFPVPPVESMTWECLMKPPQMPRVAVWLVGHLRFAVGIFKGHVVVRVDTQVYVTAHTCAMENTVKHWAGTFRTAKEVPALYCNDEEMELVRLEQVEPGGVVRLDNVSVDLAEPANTPDGRVRMGWTSKPNRMREAGVHLVVSEFRLWRGALPPDTLSTWKVREVSYTHPYCVKLVAYWRLNNQSHSRRQLDLSGSGHDLHLVGFDDVHWVLLHPVHVRSTNPVLHVQFHHQPEEHPPSAPPSPHVRPMQFAIDIVCHDGALPAATKSHLVLVLDTSDGNVTVTTHERNRIALALQQLIALVPAHTEVAVLTPQGPLLKWRRMDPLGKREAAKVVKASVGAPTGPPPRNDATCAVEAALELVASECHNVASTTVFWSATVVVVTTHGNTATMATPRLRQLWALVQHATRISHVLLTASSRALDDPSHTNPPAPIAHNIVEYAYALDDIEWVVSDLLFRATHATCHSVQVQIVSTTTAIHDNVRLHLSNASPLATSRDAPEETTRDGVVFNTYTRDIGVMAACDRIHLSGSFAWTQPVGQSVEVHVLYRVCGTLLAAASFVAIPPYAMVQQLTQQLVQTRPATAAVDGDKKTAAACRADARRVDALYHHRNAFLEHVNDLETSNAQKHFEQLRATKEEFSQQFQAFADDVVAFVHETDVATIVDEGHRALRPPKVATKKAVPVFVYQDSQLGGLGKDADAAPHAPYTGQWVEPLALLQAKGRIEDADVEFAESVRCLRSVDADLKRTDNVFITAAEIDGQLDTWLGRLRATRRVRTEIAPLLKDHADGGKAVLLRRMHDHRELRTATELEEVNQIVPDLHARLDGRKATDAAAVDRLQPAVAAEFAGFVQTQLAWAQARFTEAELKDKPIPREMLPFATFVWCPCDRPSVRNALQALVFALRTRRKHGQPHVPVCPPVHSHDRPLWVQDEQLVSLPHDLEGIDDVAAAQRQLLADAWQLCGHVVFVTGSFTENPVAVADAVRQATDMGKQVWHIQLDQGGGAVAASANLPAPSNSTTLELDTSFVCDWCRSLQSDQLVALPCHTCTFSRPKDSAAFGAFVVEVADMFHQPTTATQAPQTSPSTRLWSTQPVPALYQHRKSHAERQWLTKKAAHADLATARAATVLDFERHIFDRYADDLDDLLSVQVKLRQLHQATDRHSRGTVLGYDVQATGLQVEMAATTARVAWLRDQMLCLEEDAVGRMQQSRDVAAATGSLLPHRKGLKALQELGALFGIVNDECYTALQLSIVQGAEIAFVQQLASDEKTQAAIVAATISASAAHVDAMFETYVTAAPVTDADKLYNVALAQVFAFVPSMAPSNFDGDWLQRAAADLQTHEKHCIDRIEDGFLHAKDLQSILAHADQIAAAKDRFIDAYAVRSDVVELLVDLPAAVLRDVAWTRPDHVMDLEEAWDSLTVMVGRVQDEVVDRRKKYLHGRCCALFLQSVVEVAHKAWVSQCHLVLDMNAKALAAAVRTFHDTTAPRLDAERSFRAAKDDLASCRHKLRCFVEVQARNGQIQVAMRESMLHLREILATQTHVESVARQANLKQTKALWDSLAAFQSESFAAAFEDASQLDKQVDRTAVDRDLLLGQIDRSEDAVRAKEAVWKSALWVHMGAAMGVQKWQATLHALLHLVVDLESKRQRALELDLHVHAGVADVTHTKCTQFVDSALIESSMLRLELQKQTRLTQHSHNRVRVLERLCRQETELLQICQDEAARKTRLNDTLVGRCRFLDRTVATLEVAASTAHAADAVKAFRVLHHVMHSAAQASWHRCHVQTAAFAEENWLVQHRQNVVVALHALLGSAVETHDGNQATLDELRRTQDDLVAACTVGTDSDNVRPLDATHLMLFLNAKASARMARQANLKRTVLHEAMYIKRADKVEWHKVDPHCPEYVAARLAYFAAEGDLIANRLEINRADADADESQRQCQQYILTTRADNAAHFAGVNPDPALLDVPAMQTWGAFPSLCTDARATLELDLRRIALSLDLRAANVDCHEAILGGDLKSKDLVQIYGRPKRITTDAFAAHLDALVAAIATAKYIRRFLAHKAAIRRRNEVYVGATPRLRDVALLQALLQTPPALLTHATLMQIAMPYLRQPRARKGAAETSHFARMVVCSSVDWTPQRLVRWVHSLVRGQALMRSLVGVVDPPYSGRKQLHSQLITPHLQLEHHPLHIDPDTIAVVHPNQHSSTATHTIQVAWQPPQGGGNDASVVVLHWGRWMPASNEWTWESAVCASTAHRHTLPGVQSSDTGVCVGRVVVVAASNHASPVADVFYIA